MNILYGKSQNLKIDTIQMMRDGLSITLGESFSAEEFENLAYTIE